jgi:membrane-associated phospholipid phosphatase
MTDFGDLAILLPLALIILLWLVAMRCPRGAAGWLGAALFCGAATGVLKMYFFACPWSRDLVSPSGHTSLSTLVYGGLCIIVAGQIREAFWRATVLAAGGAFILAIGASRILLSAHTVLEVFVGLLIGGVALAIFTIAYLRHRPARVSLPPLVLAGVALVALLHGHELRAEGLLHAISNYLGLAAACK